MHGLPSTRNASEYGYGMVMVGMGMGMGKVWVWGAADIFRFNLPFGTPPSLRGPCMPRSCTALPTCKI